jgi:hypothetical protein
MNNLLLKLKENQMLRGVYARRFDLLSVPDASTLLGVPPFDGALGS